MNTEYVKKMLEARVYDVAVETPISPAPNLSERFGNEILIKREDMQPVHSFKLRGAYNKISALSDKELENGVIAASAGNHAQGGLKDTVANIHETGEFVVNVATWDLREQMNASATPAPRDVDEFEVAGLTKAPSELVDPPRVAESPVHLECYYTQTVSMATTDPAGSNTVVFGKVVGIHIDESVLSAGRVDMAKLQPIGRLGYLDYVKVTEVFSMDRPTWP